ncbi:hypothetical protein CBR_g26303 [Chara braunii]|uniref:Reverse transcriptase/retrotransposon-derived protein RNase H-like domain-containing protein n=1 Tax=Chara braunii TaxID=69332 RepID=A0A388L7Q1_CHABU|nr:hypothetical protein CBR_g26303 [Chara braunii]|eukprot:GBG78272.1 hypothetical protein CBR_g26303 [Chara braunii]
MTDYYRPFVKNYRTIAALLTDLTRLDTPWEWSEECEAAFKKLKYALTHYEVLKLPAPDKPFVVTTDASQYGICAVLAQKEGPKLRPIEYTSKKMPSQKLARSTYERELYALYRPLVHWRHYLLGRFFYVRSDHETLRWIKTQPVLSDALKRWIQVIDMYDYQLDPIKGEYNKVADALSPAESMSSGLAIGNEKLTVQNASEANPGLPPSSLMALQRQNPDFPGVLVTEYDSTFRNQYYQGHLDDSGNVDEEAISQAATLIARALFLLAGGGPTADHINANSSLISSLASCLLTWSPGLSCPLAQALMTPRQAFANHYAGVIAYPYPTPHPANIDDTARLVWNFMASRTDLEALKTREVGPGSLDNDSTPIRCSLNCSVKPGQVCVGSRANEKGVCMTSTTTYVPAYSTRLSVDKYGVWSVLPIQGDSPVLDLVDPVFTESYWRTLTVRAFKQDSASFESGMLTLGSLMTASSLAVAFGTRLLFAKRLKNL